MVLGSALAVRLAGTSRSLCDRKPREGEKRDCSSRSDLIVTDRSARVCAPYAMAPLGVNEMRRSSSQPRFRESSLDRMNGGAFMTRQNTG